MATPEEYIYANLGNGYDEDGAYGVQCVDGFKHFCRTVLNFNIGKKTICDPTNLATSIWDNFEKYGFNKYFDKVAGNEMTLGDWTIWKTKSADCPDSHIAMFIKDNGDGTGIFMGQNQYGKRAYTQKKLRYDGVRGAFRPKIYHQNIQLPKADQVLYKGSIACFYGCQIDDIKTIGNRTTFYSKKYGTWLPIDYFYRVGADGKRYPNQISSKGNYLMSDIVFRVKSVTTKPDRAVIVIDNKDYNVLSSGLYEISNN